MKPFVQCYAPYFGMYVFWHGWEAQANSRERQRSFCGAIE